MPRTLILPLIAVVVALSLWVPGGSQARQYDTTAAPPATAEPLLRETLGRVASSVAPGRDLLLTRRTFQPGADSGAHPAAGPVVLFVASGPVNFLVGDGGAALATVAGEERPVAAGEEVMLETGDSVAYDEGVVHTVGNPGPAEAITIEARLNPTEAGAVPASPAASPVP